MDTPHFVYKLSTGFTPNKIVKTGNIYRNGRVWCMLDTLFTGDTDEPSQRDESDYKATYNIETDSVTKIEPVRLPAFSEIANTDFVQEKEDDETVYLDELTEENHAAPLTEDDFKVSIGGLVIQLGDDPEEMIETLGNPYADEDNNYGFVGWDPEGENKYHHIVYEEYDNIDVFIKTRISTGESIISQIDLPYTNRDVKIGDPYSLIIQKYGKPFQEELDDSEHHVYYKLNDRSLHFYLFEGTIRYITIYQAQSPGY